MIQAEAKRGAERATSALPRALQEFLRALPLVLIVGATGAQAQAPTPSPALSGRMASMVVPYPAGGPADVTARQIEPAMRRSLGHGFIIENMPGASGAIAIEKVLQAPKDGHMVLFADASNVILAPLALSAVRHKPEQLRLVGMASRTPLLLVSGMQLSASTLKELLAAARKPGAAPLTYGSFGAGSVPHLAGEDFALRQGIKMTHVPYRGAAPLMQDLVGGQVQLAFMPMGGNTVDMIQQKKLKAYAITDGHRAARMAETPTMAEAIGLQDFNFEMWGGIFASREVPVEIATRLNKAVDEGLVDPDFRRQLEAAGGVVGARMNLDELGKFYAAEVAKFAAIAAAIRLQPQ